jgi:membrane fusion protein (multidrug efflux system)
LKAGLTTDIRIKHQGADSSLLIPYKGIVDALGESFVFVVENGHAYQRKVSLGTRIGGMIVVKGGLAQGQQVVVEGVQKLRDSSAVSVAPPKAPTAK